MSAVGLYGIGLGLCVGLIVIGGAYGISRIASAALESTGRQPEAAGDIQTQMVIAAALIEGFTFAAIGVAAYGIFVTSTLTGPEKTSDSAGSHAELNKPGQVKQVEQAG